MLKRLIYAAALCFVLSSCHTSGEVAYISNAEHDVPQAITASYVSPLQYGDELQISVVSSTPEGVEHINLHGRVPINKTMTAADFASQSYRVGDDGAINVPYVGRVQVVDTATDRGMSADSLALFIAKTLADSGYVGDAQAYVRRTNLKVAVLGEVVRPGVFVVDGERLTLFEALALAGDLTIYGLRKNVIVMRQQDGVEHFAVVDLTDKAVFDSPAYYLQQNDVIYVEPNDSKKKLADLNTQVPQYISLGVSAARIASLIAYSRSLSDHYNRSR